MDDIELYRGVSWLERRHIVGKVRGSVLIPSNTLTDFNGLSDSYPTWDT
jgi:hypothetical protein